MFRNRPRRAMRGTSVDRRAVFEAVEPRRMRANLPAGLADELGAGGLQRPVAMDFAPDGRIFVTEQPGRVRVIKNGQVQPTPFVTLPVSSTGERGALGITLDPNFSANGFVYVYYTANTPTIHNRVSRFTASGDVAAAGSETVLDRKSTRLNSSHLVIPY